MKKIKHISPKVFQRLKTYCKKVAFLSLASTVLFAIFTWSWINIYYVYMSYFDSSKNMDSFTLNLHNSFQNQNNRKAPHAFAPRSLIFWNKNFQKKRNSYSQNSVLCDNLVILILFVSTFNRAVLFGNNAFSILILSTKKRYSSFFEESFYFSEYLFQS